MERSARTPSPWKSQPPAVNADEVQISTRSEHIPEPTEYTPPASSAPIWIHDLRLFDFYRHFAGLITKLAEEMTQGVEGVEQEWWRPQNRREGCTEEIYIETTERLRACAREMIGGARGFEGDGDGGV